MNVLTIYRLYLQARASVIGHPLRRGSYDSLQKRNDFHIFERLTKAFGRRGIDLNEARIFMRANQEELKEAFLPSNLIRRSAYDTYLKYRKENKSEPKQYLIDVRRGLRIAENYISEQSLSYEEYFFKGSPPPVVKHYKDGTLDDSVIIYAEVIENRPDDKLLPFLLGPKFMRNMDIVRRRIETVPELRRILEDGFAQIRSVASLKNA